MYGGRSSWEESMSDTYDDSKVEVTLGGVKYTIDDVKHEPLIRDDLHGAKGIEDISFHREVTDGDRAFMEWLLDIDPRPLEPYRFPTIVFGVVDGFIIEFYQVLMKPEVRTKDEVRVSFDHEGYKMWFECSRSGAYIWDDDTKIMAMEWGVYTTLGMTLR
jgi:hypothetical protein